jgi:hypothetical protein
MHGSLKHEMISRACIALEYKETYMSLMYVQQRKLCAREPSNSMGIGDDRREAP